MPRRRAPQPAAGGPVTSRRKLAKIDPPPVDRISALSDDLLREIIVLLPIKDGGRTQALAWRWRHLWLSAPLNLDCCDLGFSTYRSSDVSAALSRILSAHPGPVRRLCSRIHYLYSYYKNDDWLRSAALDRLEELEFTGPMHFPTSIFRFSDTLGVASIVDCVLPDDIVRGLHFPRLKQLGLERVNVSEHSLHGLIARCPVLEFLLIHGTSGFQRLQINSPSLTRLSVRIDPYVDAKIHFDEIIIENAPRLQRLIFPCSIWGLDVSVYYAPNVETLDFLVNLRNLVIKLACASTSIQESPVGSLTKAAHAVKSLSISMDLLSLDKVVDLMRLFPCLEKVHVKSGLSHAKPWWRQNWWRRKHRDFVRCHDIRVKSLVLEPYLGTLSHINFATFFVLNARELELMEFQIKANVYNDGFLAEQHRKLHLDNKASRAARFHFTTTSCQCDVLSNKHLRDFNLHDPFLARCGC